MVEETQEQSKPTPRRHLHSSVRAHFEDGVGLREGSTVVDLGPWMVDFDSYPAIASYVDVHHGPWLTAFHIMHTRIRAPYVTPDGFRFWVYHKTRMTSVRKLFGMQDIVTGYAEFDHAFVLRGNDEEKAKAVIGNWKIRDLLIAYPAVHLLVKSDEGRAGPRFPENVHELCLEVPHAVKHAEEMGALCDLFEETLDCLCAMGSAVAERPELALV